MEATLSSVLSAVKEQTTGWYGGKRKTSQKRHKRAREGTKGKTKPALAKHKTFYSGGLYVAQTSLVA